MNRILLRCGQLFLLSALLVLAFPSCKKDPVISPDDPSLAKNEDATVALAWMNLYLEFDRYAQSYRPGPSPRALAYINLAAYESAMMGMPDYRSLSNLYGLKMPVVEEGKEYNIPVVVNAVYASLTKKFFPGNILITDQQTDLQFKVLNLEQQFDDEFSIKVGNKVFQRSKDYGESVADIIWEWAKTDVYGHEAFYNPRPTNYTPPQGPGLWQPTSPDFSRALYPWWGHVRTFAITQGEKLSEPPLDFSEDSNSEMYAQAQEVKNTVVNLDFTGQWIAEYWSDDFVGQMFSPPGRWIAITNQVVELEGASLETALYAYAKVSMALNDAGVACWHSKYTYNVERPVTYIQRVFDPAWKPHWDTTPSFPAYPSGHATFGAAAAEVLSHIFGYSYAMADHSHESETTYYGMPRDFDSFYEMAEENAISRIFLGVHFRMDAEEGLNLGYKVGRKMNQMPFKK